MALKLLLALNQKTRVEALFEQLSEEGQRSVEEFVNKQVRAQLRQQLAEAERKGDHKTADEILKDLMDLMAIESPSINGKDNGNG